MQIFSLHSNQKTDSIIIVYMSLIQCNYFKIYVHLHNTSCHSASSQKEVQHHDVNLLCNFHCNFGG